MKVFDGTPPLLFEEVEEPRSSGQVTIAEMNSQFGKGKKKKQDPRLKTHHSHSLSGRRRRR
jgi:hypothetical protein